MSYESEGGAVPFPSLESIIRRDRDHLIGEVVRLRHENERLRTGLNVIAQAGTLYGGAWCVAQAIGYRDDLDFNEFPETGKAPA